MKEKRFTIVVKGPLADNVSEETILGDIRAFCTFKSDADNIEVERSRCNSKECPCANHGAKNHGEKA